jgi:hypothetical protein
VTPGRRAFSFATLLVSTAVAWAPLVHGPGYEHALVLGILLPMPMAAFAVSEARAGASPVAALGLWASVFGAALLGACTPWARFGACAPLLDVAYEVLTLGLGLAASALWGLHSARIVSTRAAFALAVGGPLGSLVAALGIFYGTPTVHAFDAFAGYFAGPLYDTVLRLEGPFAVHRAAVTVWFAAACLLLSPRDRRSSRAASLVALTSLGCVGALGSVLGSWTTRTGLAADLPQEAAVEGCIVHASAAIKPELVARVARDAGERRRELENLFASRFIGNIHVFVFRDGEEKARLVGAADTLVAKPWRGEVYIQGTAYPHPVLGHELAHVIAGTFGRGPLRIAGRWGGVVANPGLVEGVAVSAAPHDETLSEREWTSAMADRGLLPPLDELFGLRFLSGNASRSYTAAGAFIDFVRERHGVEVLKRWYGGDDLAALVNRSWSDIEASFHAWLKESVPSDAGRRVAEARFGAPGLAARRCPHVVDGALAAADACLRDHRMKEATRTLERARALDPENAALQLLDASLLAAPDAELAYVALAANERASATVRDEALVRAGDMAWRAGHHEIAAARFREVELRSIDDARLRMLAVKEVFSSDDTTPPAIVAYLTQGVQRSDVAVDPFVLGATLASWSSPRSTPVHTAFLAQQFFLRDECPRALALAATVDDAALPPALARAMLRGRLVCNCVAHAAGGVAAALGALDAPGMPVPRAMRASLVRLAERCVVKESSKAPKSP